MNESGKMAGSGGVEIFWRAWPLEKPRGAVILAHGLGEHSGRYGHVAEVLNAKGISAFALDHRGHGQSGGKRGHVMNFSEFLDDLDLFRKQVEGSTAKLPLFLLGHSMGGLIAARYAETRGAGLAGLILSSAALRVDIDAPAIKLALDPNYLSHDRKVVADYLADPLVHDRVSARWFTEFTGAIETVQAEAAKITMPTLVMQSGEDRLVAPRGAPEFFGRLTVQDKTLQVWEGFYHEMFNEVEKEKPLTLMQKWIEEHLN